VITRDIWWNFEFKVTCTDGSYNYSYKERELAWLLLGTILGTPFAIILDILTLPIQIIYCICEKKVRKIRNKG